MAPYTKQEAPFIQGRDPSTSREAAESMTPEKKAIQYAKLLKALRVAGPLGGTREELEHQTGILGNSIRPRLVELQDKGLVMQTTRRRKTLKGKDAFVLVAVECALVDDEVQPKRQTAWRGFQRLAPQILGAVEVITELWEAQPVEGRDPQKREKLLWLLTWLEGLVQGDECEK